MAFSAATIMFAVMKQTAATPSRRNEWELERMFREEGPFFHLHTEPLKTGVIFMNDEERAIALVYVAIAAVLAEIFPDAGILPADHMNKEHWLSLLLDGTADDGDIRELLEISYDLTKGKN